jgi:hypothetical protein
MSNEKNKSAAIIADRYNMKLLTKPVISPSGQFIFFLGHHYSGKEECYDVCAAKMSVRPIQVTRRHHKTKEEALVSWEETNKELKRIEEKPHERGDRSIVIVPKGGRVQ